MFVLFSLNPLILHPIIGLAGVLSVFLWKAKLTIPPAPASPSSFVCKTNPPFPVRAEFAHIT